VPLDAPEPGDLVFFNPGEFIAGLPGALVDMVAIEVKAARCPGARSTLGW